MATENSTCLLEFLDLEYKINLILSIIFFGFIPYAILLTFYYFSRKTDDKLSHKPIHKNLMVLGISNVSGSLILAAILKLLQNYQAILEKSYLIPSFYKCASCLLKHWSLIITTIFYYILFQSACQRLFLLVNSKLGTRVMTGRRLISNLVILYFVGIISAFNKIMVENKTPWLEIITIIITLLMYLFGAFMVHHIERRSVAIVHTTVLAQTAPLAVFLALLTVARFYVLTSGQQFILTWTFQTVMAFSISIATPFFLIIGSGHKRKIVILLISCKWEQNSGRDGVYSAERSPGSMSNVVSMTPTSRF